MRTDTESNAEAGNAAGNAEPLHDSPESVAARFAEIESKLCAGYEDMLVSAKEIGDVTSHHVRLHPLAACAMAFLAGVALTRILRN